MELSSINVSYSTKPDRYICVVQCSCHSRPVERKSCFWSCDFKMDRQEQGTAASMTEHKTDHVERAPKPKMTKAERRELQERQRADKLASRGSSGGQGTSSSGSTGPKAAQGAASPPPINSSKTASAQVIPLLVPCTVSDVSFFILFLCFN